MNILTIDSTEKRAKLSLEVGNKKDYFELNENENHSEFLLLKIDEMLTRNNTTIQDIDFISVNLGPGSFTGVRIGVSFAKAFLMSLNIKAVSVNSFEIIEHNINSEKYLIVLNSNNDDVYYSSKVNGVVTYGAMNINELEDFALKNGLVIFCKNSELKYFENISVTPVQIKHESMLEITKEKILKSAFCDINNLNPMYIKKSQAERELKQKIASCINIFKATIENLNDILCLEKCFEEPYSENILINELNSSNREYYLASYNNQIISYIGFEICDDGINLLKICVKDEFRNLGVAKILMQKMFETAIQKGLNKLFLEVDAKNKQAINLYQNLGFKIEYTRHKYYKNGDDALIMFKYL